MHAHEIHQGAIYLGLDGHHWRVETMAGQKVLVRRDDEAKGITTSAEMSRGRFAALMVSRDLGPLG